MPLLRTDGSLRRFLSAAPKKNRRFCLPSVVALDSAGKASLGRFLPPVPLMVDSGADDSFIDETLARQAGLPLVELDQPRVIQDLNGRTLAHATCHTASLTLLVSGNHREKIQLFLISSTASPG